MLTKKLKYESSGNQNLYESPAVEADHAEWEKYLHRVVKLKSDIKCFLSGIRRLNPTSRENFERLTKNSKRHQKMKGIGN